MLREVTTGGRYPTTRRGAFLLVVGAIYAVIGLSYAVLPIPTSTKEGYDFANQLLPIPVWGAIWAAVGLFGVVSARWPVGKDYLGFAALAWFSLLWMALSACSSIFYGASRGWFLAVIWGAFGLLLTIVSGMDDRRE